MRTPHILVAFLLATVPLVALGPLGDARPTTPAFCTDEVNDAGCGGTLCAWPTPTSAGYCTPFTATDKVCTEGHAPCDATDLVCVYGKHNECLSFVCACMPLQAQSGCAGCVPTVCVAGVTAPECWGVDGTHDVCVYYSLEVPFCADSPVTISINCAVLRPACDPTDPCGWGYFECAPCECVPANVAMAVPML